MPWHFFPGLFLSRFKCGDSEVAQYPLSPHFETRQRKERGGGEGGRIGHCEARRNDSALSAEREETDHSGGGSHSVILKSPELRKEGGSTQIPPPPPFLLLLLPFSSPPWYRVCLRTYRCPGVGVRRGGWVGRILVSGLVRKRGGGGGSREVIFISCLSFWPEWVVDGRPVLPDCFARY